jgi:hypothetical protein
MMMWIIVAGGLSILQCSHDMILFMKHDPGKAKKPEDGTFNVGAA